MIRKLSILMFLKTLKLHGLTRLHLIGRLVLIIS